MVWDNSSSLSDQLEIPPTEMKGSRIYLPRENIFPRTDCLWIFSQGSCVDWSSASWYWDRRNKTLCSNIRRRSVQVTWAEETIIIVFLYFLLGSESWQPVFHAPDPSAASQCVLPWPGLLLSPCIWCSSCSYVCSNRYTFYLYHEKDLQAFPKGLFLLVAFSTCTKLICPTEVRKILSRRHLGLCG